MRLSLFLLITFLSFQSKGQELEMYVSDAGNWNLPPWQILVFDATGNNGKVFTQENLDWPQDILFLEDQDLVLISNLNSGEINMHNASNGQYVGSFAIGIGGPTRMEIGPEGYIYILQWTGNGKVLRYTQTGEFVDEFTSTGVGNSIGLAWDSLQNLYVSSYNGKYIQKFDSSGQDQGRFADSTLQGPTNIWFNEEGNLMVSDYSGGSIKSFSNSGNYLGEFATGLSQSEGVDFLPNGDLVIGNGGTGAVKQFSPTGTFIADLVPSGTLNLIRPNAVVLRNTKINSIHEIGLKTNFVIPSVGRQFYVHTQAADHLANITIFSTEGNVVYKANVDGTRVWDAETQNSGNYIVYLEWKSGNSSFQRIIVQ